MNKIITLVLAVVVAGLIGWYMSLQQTEQALASLIKKAGMPEYTGEQLSTMIYDQHGKPQYFAQAAQIKRYEESERTEFSRPLLQLFDPESGQKQWQITANDAEMTKEKLLHLNGEVRLISLDQTARLQRLDTERLTVDLTSQDIFSDKAVRTQGNGIATQGIGLKGNLKQQIATLLNDVKTQIEPTVIEQKPSKESQ